MSQYNNTTNSQLFSFSKKCDPNIAKACARKLFALYARNNKAKLTDNDVFSMLSDTYKGISSPFSLSSREINGFSKVLDRDGDGDITLEDLELICLDILCGIKNPLKSSSISARITQKDSGSFVHFKAQTNELSRSQLSQRAFSSYGNQTITSNQQQQQQQSQSSLLNSNFEQRRSGYFNQTQINTENSTLDVVRKVFEKFDIDGNGFIDAYEIKNLLQETYNIMKMKKEVTDEDVYYYLKMVDTNGDGKVSLSEFEGLFMKSINRLGLANSLKNSGVLKRSTYLQQEGSRRSSRFSRNASSSNLRGSQYLHRSAYLDQSPNPSKRGLSASNSTNDLKYSKYIPAPVPESDERRYMTNASSDISSFRHYKKEQENPENSETQQQQQQYQSQSSLKFDENKANDNLITHKENTVPLQQQSINLQSSVNYGFKPKSQFFQSGKTQSNTSSQSYQPGQLNSSRTLQSQINVAESLKSGFNEIVKKVFKSFDRDGNGVIDIGELKFMLESVYKSFGIPKQFNQRDVQQYLEMMDNNHDGCIQLEEFQSLFSKSLDKWSQLRFIPKETSGNVLQDSTNSPKKCCIPSASIDLSSSLGKNGTLNFTNTSSGRSGFYVNQNYGINSVNQSKGF